MKFLLNISRHFYLKNCIFTTMIKSSEVKDLTKDFSILYVEDEQAIRESMASILGKYFKNVATADDGTEGLNEYKHFYDTNGFYYDIVITDLEMPKLSGFDFIRKLKEINPEVHTIILSAYSDAHNLKEAINIGVDGFLEKPFNQFNFFNVLYSSAKCILARESKRLENAALEKAVKSQTEIIENNLKVDSMTGLPNSFALFETLKVPNDKIAVLLDIDRYSDINYTYGVEFGDKLLKEVSELLKATVPKNAELFRLGSDEFILLYDGSLDDTKNYAEMVTGFFKAHTITYNGIDIKVNWNIGISLEQTDKISTAKIAVKVLKDNKGMNYHIYQKDSKLLARQKDNINKALILKDLLENDTVTPYFQPIVDVQTKEIVKYEALARLIDNDIVYTPEYFIESARSTKMLSVITKNMISKTFKIVKDKNIDISLNITQEDFNSEYLIEFLKISLNRHSIDPKNITLEILEDITTAKNDYISVEKQIQDLKDLGFLIAIDDFGSENANFSRLLDINADYIKIDGMFIKDLDRNEESVKIVKSIVFLAQQLGAKTIAEYVGDEYTFNIIKDLGIDYAQGFFFGKPEASF